MRSGCLSWPRNAPLAECADLFSGQLGVMWQKVTRHFFFFFFFTHYPYHLVLNTFYACHVFLARRHHLSPPFFFLPFLSLFAPLLPSPYVSEPLFYYFFFPPSPLFFSLDFLQSAPQRPKPEHLQVLTLKDVARPKNARSKHMRAVFIINQLYGPLMEVISAKFMLRAFRRL